MRPSQRRCPAARRDAAWTGWSPPIRTSSPAAGRHPDLARRDRMSIVDGRPAKTPVEVVARRTSRTSSPGAIRWPTSRHDAKRRPRPRPAALFFRKMYGDCHAGQVTANLVKVRWVDGTSCRITRVNGVARRWPRSSTDLAALGPAYASTSRPAAEPTTAARSPARRWPRCTLWSGDRPQRQRTATTGCGPMRPRTGSAPSGADPDADRAGLRAPRLHLGRPLGRLRHHAFRVPPRDHRRGQGERGSALAPFGLVRFQPS